MGLRIMSRPCLIGLDWGTSSLRAMLIDRRGQTIEEQFRPWGVMHLPVGSFTSAYADVTSIWRTEWPDLPCLATGMVGSRQGWIEAPYCDAPATIEMLATRLTSVPDVGMHIVPGVALRGARPDVMRGEETQVFGSLDQGKDRCIVLPGSHSKWVTMESGSITDFHTFMTGEIFAALRDHTILGTAAASEKSTEAFDRGVLAARAASGGIAPLLFSARSLALDGQLNPSATLDYLSGLLIGDELHIARSNAKPLLIGDADLCRRYLRAMNLYEIAAEIAAPGAAAKGLWRIACAAGLIPG
jgi:2-dehydro-3-deoxygalactonokinase